MEQVYLIRAANGLYKIGFTSNIEHRFNILRAQSPIPLELILCFNGGNARELETGLHDKFSDKRHHGEWFELSDEDLDYIRAQDITYKMTRGESGIKRFEDRMGRVGYSAKCPHCKNRSRVQHGDDTLILECKHCGTVTRFPISEEEQNKRGPGRPRGKEETVEYRKCHKCGGKMRPMTEKEEREFWGNPSEEDWEEIIENSHTDICDNCGWTFTTD